jgi:UDP-glucose 4-epimerase
LAFDRVLVTGGAGFIGSHTVDRLLENGAEVWVLDDLSTGRLSNLKQWRKNPKLHFKRGSVTNRRMVNSLARKVDAVVHLAALVSPAVSISHPELTNEINVSGTVNVLNAARRSRIGRVVFASSSSVYDEQREISIAEDARLSPITPYGVSKLAAEQYCRVFHSTYGLGTVALRYFNVYGERQSSNPYSGVIAIFARRLSRGLRPCIHGDGRQTRDFIHVSDVVQANLLALSSKAAVGQAFNVGTGRAVTMNGLFREFSALLRVANIKPRHTAPRDGDIRNSHADITKARKLLGFSPKISLSRGLALTVSSHS